MVKVLNYRTGWMDRTDREDALQTAQGLAWGMFKSLRKRGLPIFPSAIAGFAVKQTLAGREVPGGGPGGSHGPDALDAGATTGGGMGGVADRRPQAEHIVAIQEAFRHWLDSLPERLQRMARDFATGMSGLEAAAKYGISPGRVTQVRHELRDSWNEFWFATE